MLPNDRTPDLVDRLHHWQCPDGGWNCDKNPDADTSAFSETLLPMRGLIAYANAYDSSEAREVAWEASEAMLSRRVVYRRSDRALIQQVLARRRCLWQCDDAC